jgi:hypothetical protein
MRRSFESGNRFFYHLFPSTYYDIPTSTSTVYCLPFTIIYSLSSTPILLIPFSHSTYRLTYVRASQVLAYHPIFHSFAVLYRYPLHCHEFYHGVVGKLHLQRRQISESRCGLRDCYEESRLSCFATSRHLFSPRCCLCLRVHGK